MKHTWNIFGFLFLHLNLPTQLIPDRLLQINVAQNASVSDNIVYVVESIWVLSIFKHPALLYRYIHVAQNISGKEKKTHRAYRSINQYVVYSFSIPVCPLVPQRFASDYN